MFWTNWNPFFALILLGLAEAFLPERASATPDFFFRAQSTPSAPRDASSPPTITGQPVSQTVIIGNNYTFNVTATGTAPFSFQWRFNGADLGGQTNAALILTAIRTNDAGSYAVYIANGAGSVTSAPAILTVHTTNDPVYAAPDRGWAYIYSGNAASAGVTNSLDGTWNRQNGTDSWFGDGRGTNNGPLGGIGVTNGILTIEDDVAAGSGSLDNRRFYMTHNLAQDTTVSNATTLLNDGVTLSFRARLTPPAPADPLTELASAPSGFVNVSDGKGMFGIRQAGSSGMLISLSLNQAIEDLSTNTTFNFGQAGLHMNTLNGNSRSPNIDPGEGGMINLLPLDPAVFHEFWITIQDNGSAPGTHSVSIYLDGSRTPNTFNLTAGTGSDGPATNYLALGLPSTPQRGAVDVDFFGYKPGVIPPSGLNDLVGIVLQPTNQIVPAGQIASFSVGVTGAPPYFFQWYKNGLAIDQATNNSYTTPPAGPADAGSAFIVTVANIFNAVTSTPPASLSILPPPVIVTQPQSLTVAYGDPASFSVIVQSEATAAYRWRFNGNPLPGAADPTLNINAAQPAHAGAYDVVVTNNGGAVTSVVAVLTVNSFDFGDAPAPYPTLIANNGARHLIVPGVYLGATIDAEVDGQPNATATADNDDDGVTFTTSLFAGRTAAVQVIASTNGFLDAWIDFAGTGTWADAGDEIFSDQKVVAGTNLVNFLVPAGATAGSTFARFRFSTAGGLLFDGPAPDGEVEDYAVSVLPAADLAVSIAASADPVAVSSNLVYSINVSNVGPSLATGVVVTNLLPGNISFISSSSSQGNCAVSGGTLLCALGNLGVHSSATISITVAPTSSGVLTSATTVAGNESDFVLANNNASITVTAQASPAITMPPVSLTVTQGNNLILSVVATGTAPLLYQWQLNGADLNGRTNASLSINNAQLSDGGAYAVRVRNGVGAVVSAPATVTVLTPPSITRQPQSRTNLAGGTVTLSVGATGTDPLSYQWQFNGGLLVGETNATLTLANVQKIQTGNYAVVVRNNIAAVTSAMGTLTVIEMDFGDAPDPPYPTRLASNGARHRVVPGFFLGAGIDYEPDGQANSSATGDDLSGSADEDGVTFLTPLFAGQSASLRVIASSNGLLNAWIDFNGNGNWADTGDQVFTNQALVAGTNLVALRVPSLITGTNSFARFRFSSQADLSFLGEARDGEVEDYAVAVNAAIDLAVSVTAQPVPVAVGSNLTYTILLTNAGPSVATGVTLNDVLPSSALFMSVASSRGSCSNSGGTVTCLIGNLAPGATATVTITCSPTAPGILTNIASVAAAEYDPVSINNAVSSLVGSLVYPAITESPQSLTVTSGNSASFSVAASGSALDFQWRFNGIDVSGQTNSSLLIPHAQPEQAGNYTVRVRNGVGAVVSDPAALVVFVPPQITGQPRGQTVLAGGQVSLSVSASGTAPLLYQWRLNGTDLVGETRTTLILNNLQPSQSGAYVVQVSNGAGSVLSDPALVGVLVPPAITQPPQSRTDNAGGPTFLAVIASGTDPLNYQWYSNAGNQIPGATNSTLLFPNAQKSQSGSFYVVITNSAGAVTSGVVSLTILEMDFGDAPDSMGYPTLMIFNGARHQIVPGVHLGAAIDFEPDGQPNPTATGDGDDDGVLFTSPLLIGQTATLDIIASTNGFVDAWMDWNRNGSWSDPGEQIFISQAVMAGTNHLSFSLPAQTLASNTFARFRFSTTGGLSFDGPAADGEVEDYVVTITPAIDLGIVVANSPDPVVAGSNLTYTITINNLGPSAASGVSVLDKLPPGNSLLRVTASQGACTNDGDTLNCQLGILPSGAQAVITLVATPNRTGVLTNTASVTANEVDLNPADNIALTDSTAIANLNPFVNSGMINVPDFSPATQYPAAIIVSGVTAAVYKVTVTLSNLAHTFPADFDILLVGPRGQSVILMSDAGTVPIQNVTLIFDDDSPLSLPEEGRIVSQTFKPTNYPSGDDPDVFPAPAPPPPYGAQLSVFAGTDPNGLWSLYVVDDQLQDSGFIANGWSLNLATLNPITDLSVGAFATPNPVAVGSNLTFTVSVTNQGPATATGVNLTDQLPPGLNFVSATPSQGACINNNGLVTCALANLTVGGIVTVTVTATPTVVGAFTNVAIVASGDTDFNLSNNMAATVATVRPVTDLSLGGSSSHEPVELHHNLAYTLSVTNAGLVPATAVTLSDTLPNGFNFVSVTSSQGTCATSAGAFRCDLGDLSAGAVASINLIGTADQTGTITNTASVISSEIDLNFANNTVQQLSSVVVTSAPYSDAGGIAIASLGMANPYPSTIRISGVTAAVFQVTVILSNLTHAFPDDLDILLVGPSGQKSMLISDVGGGFAISNVTLTLDDNAASSLPATGQLSSGTFRPANFDPQSPAFPAPAPAGPYSTALSAFKGTDPNGVWSLYVLTEAAHNSGLIAGGWGLTISTLNPIADLVIAQFESPNPAMPGSNVTYSLSVANLGPAGADGVAVTDLLPANMGVVSVLSSQGAWSNANGLIICALGSLAVGSNATVTIVASANAAGTFTNSAIITGQEMDVNLSNNVATVVTIVGSAPMIILQPQGQTRTNQESVTFHVAATGSDPLVYQWQHNGADLLNATNQDLTLNNLTLLDSGNYSVRVNNPAGSVLSGLASLTVFSRPTISMISDQFIDEDTLDAISFTVGDVETPAGNLAVTGASSNPALVPNANLVFGGSGGNRTLSVQPATNQFGITAITLTVTDGDGIFASATFRLTVRSVNDPPTISSLIDHTINEDTASGPIPFLIGDLETAPENLILSGGSSNTGLVSSAGISFGGTGASRTLTVLPLHDQFGPTTITVRVADGDGGQATSSFLLFVNSVNDTPTLDPLHDLTINEDAGTQSVNLSGITSGAPNENQTLTLTALNGNPALLSNVKVSYASPATNAILTFTTVSNAYGTALISMMVDDGESQNSSTTRIFTVTVNPANDPPTLDAIGDLTISGDAGPQMIVLTGISSGAPNENDSMSLSAVSANPGLVGDPTVSYTSPNGFAILRFAPQVNSNGTAGISVTVNDGQPTNNIVTRSFSVIVFQVNHSPAISLLADQVIDQNTASGPLSFTVGDAETPASTLTVAGSSSNPRLVPNSNIIFGGSGSNHTVTILPSINQIGTTLIKLTVTDAGGSSATASFLLTVNFLNTPPTLSPLSDLNINEDSGTQTVTLMGIGAGATNENQILRVTAISSNPGLISNPTVNYSTPNPSGTLSFAPLPDANGTAVLTVTIDDGQPVNHMVTRSFAVTVNAVNDPPTLDPILDLNINEDAGLQMLMLTGITSGAANENQTLVVSAISSNPSLIPNPAVNYASANPTGTLTFASLTNANGTATISVTINDGGASNNIASKNFTVTVNPVNDPPTISAIANRTILEETSAGPLVFTINDVDTPLASLIVSGTSSNPALVPNGNLVFGGSGSSRTLAVLPAPNQFGVAIITVTVSDGQASANSPFMLTVIPANHPPTLSSFSDQTTNQGAVFSLPFAVNDVETPLANLTVTGNSSNPALVPAANLIFAGSGANRTLTVIPAANQVGAATITVIVSDGMATASNSFVLTINPVAPVITSQPQFQTVSNGASVTMSVAATGTAPLIYQWQHNGTNLSGATNATLVFPNVQLTDTGTYTVVVSNSVGSLSSAAAGLTVTTAAAPAILIAVSSIWRYFDQGLDLGTSWQGLNFDDTAWASGPGELGYTAPGRPGHNPVTVLSLGPDPANKFITYYFRRKFVVPNVAAYTNLLFRLRRDDGAVVYLNNVEVYRDNMPAGPISYTTLAASIVSGTNETTYFATNARPSLLVTGTNILAVEVHQISATNVDLGFDLELTGLGANPPPAAISSIPDQFIKEDTSLTIPFTVSVPEVTPLSLKLTGVSPTNTALIAFTNVFFTGSGSNRTMTLLPNSNQFGAALMTVTADNGIASAASSFILTVNPVNYAPTLDPIWDYRTVAGAAQQNIVLTGITSGATNENQTLTVTASAGSLFTPTVSYTNGLTTAVLRFKPGNTAGSNMVTVTVNDGGSSNNFITRSFTVFVRSSGNNPPNLSVLPDATTLENTTLGPIAFTVGDAETSASNLTLRAQSSNPGLVPDTNLIFGGSGSNRTLFVTPALNQTGSCTINVLVLDSAFGGTNRSFVLAVMPVNQAPTLSPIADQTINEDRTSSPIALTVTDADTRADDLSVTASSSNPSLVPNANLFLGGGGSSRLLILSPATNQFGTAIITLTVSDGTTNNRASFLLTVNSVNDLPAVSSIPDQTISLGAPASPIPFIIGDVETAATNLILSGASSNSSLAPVTNIVFGGSGSNRTVTIIPSSGQTGNANITVTVTDANAGSASSSFLLRVNGNPANMPPTLDAIGNLALNEGAGPQTVNLTGITAGANENQFLAVSAISSNPGLLPNPSVIYTSPNGTATLHFSPSPATSGAATVTVTVNDGQNQSNLFSRSFTVTVNPSPRISSIADQMTDEDTPALAIPFTVTDAVTPASSLNLTGNSSNPAVVPNGGIVFGGSGTNRTLTLIPTPDQFGFTLITVTVANTNGNTASTAFMLAVNSVNHAPTLDAIANLTVNEDAGPQTVPITGLSPGPANETQNLIVTALSSNPGLIPNPIVNYLSPGNSGAISFTSLSNANGSALITVTVNDGQGSNNLVSRTFTVTVIPVNDAPVVSALASQVTSENMATGPIPFLVGDVDNSAGTLVVTGSSSNPVLMPNANIVFGGSGANRTINLVPSTNQTGASTITINVSDGMASVSSAFLLTVIPANTPPSISGLADQTIDEGASVGPLTVGINDAETPVRNLVLNGSSSNPTLVAETNILFGGSGGTRSVTITPSPNQFGNGIITLTVIDTNGAAATTRFNLTVNPINHPPTLHPINDLTINEDAGWQYVVLSGISAGPPSENQTLLLTATNDGTALITNLALSYFNPDPAAILSFRTMQNANGSANIIVTANDGGSSNSIVSQRFTLAVLPVNDPPTLNPIVDFTIPQNAGLQTVFLSGITAGPPDEIQHLSVTAVSSNPGLIPAPTIHYTSPNSTGILNFTPDSKSGGSAFVTVNIQDDGGTLRGGQDSLSWTFQVTVNPAAAAPALQISRAGITNLITLPTVSGKSYVVEYKSSLADPAWIPLLTVPGTGGPVAVTDAAQLGVSRFYRVRTD